MQKLLFLLLFFGVWGCTQTASQDPQKNPVSEPNTTETTHEEPDLRRDTVTVESPPKPEEFQKITLRLLNEGRDLKSIFKSLPESWQWPHETEMNKGPYYTADRMRLRAVYVKYEEERDAVDLFWLSDPKAEVKYLGLLSRKNYLSWETTMRVLKVSGDYLTNITEEALPLVPKEKLIREYLSEVTSDYSYLHQDNFYDDYSLRWSNVSRKLFHIGNGADIPLYTYDWKGDHFERKRIIHPADGGRDTVRVSSFPELIQKSMPNRVMLLTPGDWRYAENYSDITTDYVRTGPYYDPPELIFRDLDNFTLLGEGEDPSHIIQTSPAGIVLTFVNCRNLELNNIKGGHDPDVEQECNNGVFEFHNCSDVRILNCEMYGSGTVGITTRGVKDLLVEDSRIFDCSGEWMDLQQLQNSVIRRCKFEDAVGWHYFRVWESGGIAFEECTMNAGGGPIADYIFEFYKNHGPVTTKNCAFLDFRVDYFANLSEDLVMEECDEIQIKLENSRFSEKGVYD